MPPLRSAFGDEATVLYESNFQLLLLATMFPILGTALVSPLLDSVIETFGTTPGNIGLMISFLTAPAIFVIPVSGVLADRYGRKPVLVSGLLLFGAGGATIAATTDFRVILGLRFIQGIGFGFIVPVITASIGDMYEDGREVTGQGLRMMVNGISGALFPLVAGALLALAWQYPFLMYALAIPIAVLFYVTFDEPTDEPGDVEDGSNAPAYHQALYGLVRRPTVTAAVIGRAMPIATWIGFMTYNSLIVVRIMGGTPFQAGVLVAVGNIVFAAGASQVGRLISLFGSKFTTLVAANLALGVGFIGVLFSPNVLLATGWITLSGAGFGVSISVYRSYITELAPQDLRAGVVSIGAAGARVSATVTPVMMGLIIETATPAVGQGAAIQLAGIAAALVGGGGGVLSILGAAVFGEDDPGGAVAS